MDNSWCLPSFPQNPFERENAWNLMETDRSKKVVMFILQMAKNSFQNFTLSFKVKFNVKYHINIWTVALCNIYFCWLNINSAFCHHQRRLIYNKALLAKCNLFSFQLQNDITNVVINNFLIIIIVCLSICWIAKIWFSNFVCW